MLSVVLVLVVIGVVLTTLKLTPKSNAAIPKDVKELQKDADVIIVGGGVVGATLGSVLGKQGKKVLVFERNLGEPNRIVGELMQPGGVEHMHTLGLEGKKLTFHNLPNKSSKLKEVTTHVQFS